jgi:hypothetical protein
MVMEGMLERALRILDHPLARMMTKGARTLRPRSQ